MSQPPNYEDLRIYYADGNFEAVIKKAEKYILKGCKPASPAPYMWLSMVNYRMIFDSCGPHDEAYRDAIKYATRGLKIPWRSIDSTDFYEYIEELRLSLISDVKELLDTEYFERLILTAMRYQRVSKNGVGAKYLEGLAYLRTKDKILGKINIQEADEMLDNYTQSDSWGPNDSLILKIGVVEYNKYLLERQDSLTSDSLLLRASPFLN